MSDHNAILQNLCRICGKPACQPRHVNKEVTLDKFAFKSEFEYLFGVNVDEDVIGIHPDALCQQDIGMLTQCRKALTLGTSYKTRTTMISFQPHDELRGCQVCSGQAYTAASEHRGSIPPINHVVKAILDLPVPERLECLKKIVDGLPSQEKASLKSYLAKSPTVSWNKDSESGPIKQKRQKRSYVLDANIYNAVVKIEPLDESFISSYVDRESKEYNLEESNQDQVPSHAASNVHLERNGSVNGINYEDTAVKQKSFTLSTASEKYMEPNCTTNQSLDYGKTTTGMKDFVNLPQNKQYNLEEATQTCASLGRLENKERVKIYQDVQRKDDNNCSRKVKVKLPYVKKKRKGRNFARTVTKQRRYVKGTLAGEEQTKTSSYQCIHCGVSFTSKIDCEFHSIGHTQDGPQIIKAAEVFKKKHIMMIENNPKCYMSVKVFRKYCRQHCLNIGVSKTKCMLCDTLHSESRPAVWHVILHHFFPRDLYYKETHSTHSEISDEAKLAFMANGLKDRIIKAEHQLIQCPLCKVTFTCEKFYNAHGLVHRDADLARAHEFTHECAKCRRCFDDENKLQLHEQEHFEELDVDDLLEEGITRQHMYLCKYCGEVNKTEAAKLVHEVMHTQVPTPSVFRCKACKLSFDDPKLWQKHVDKGHLMSLCPKCPKFYYTKAELLTHIQNTPNHKATFCCEKCGSSFARVLQLRKHQEVEHEGRLPCRYCSYRTFPNVKERNAHIVSSHFEKSNGFQCSLCKKSFYSRSDLRFHCNHVHPEEGRILHRCLICHKEFIKAVDLDVHTQKEHNLNMGAKCGNVVISHVPTDTSKEERHNINEDDLEETSPREMSSDSLNDETPTKKYKTGESKHENISSGKVKKQLQSRLESKIDKQTSYATRRSKQRQVMRDGREETTSFQCGRCRQTFNTKEQCDRHSLNHNTNDPSIIEAVQDFKKRRIINNNQECYMSINVLRTYCRQHCINVGVSKSKCMLCDSFHADYRSAVLHVIQHHLFPKTLYCEENKVSQSLNKQEEGEKQAQFASMMRGLKDRILSVKHYLIQCSLCKVTFTQQNFYDSHVKIHTKADYQSAYLFTHECSKCKRCFDTEYKLQSHKQAHTKELDVEDLSEEGITRQHMYLCKHCGEVYRTEAERDEHFSMYKEIPASALTCKACKVTFDDPKQWHEHVEKGHLMCLCPKCPKFYYTKSELLSHMQSTQNHVATFCCEICGSSFSRASQLQKHQEVDHEGRVPCKYCAYKTFATVEERNYHYTTDHSDRLNRFQCELCRKSFSSKVDLESHCGQVHDGEGEIQRSCIICQKEFTQTVELSMHMQKEHSLNLDGTQHGNLTCPYCPYYTNTKNKFAQHMEKHNNNKHEAPFQCLYCDKCYLRKKSLKNHIKSLHSGRTHICDICGKELKTDVTLAKHRDWHLGIKRFPCQVCGKAFSQHYYWTTHMKKIHPEAHLEALKQKSIGKKVSFGWLEKYPKLRQNQESQLHNPVL